MRSLVCVLAVFAVYSLLNPGSRPAANAPGSNRAQVSPAPGPGVPPPPERVQPTAFDTSKLTPLTELGGTYHGFGGGLYRHGNNHPPREHLAAGLAQARLVQPLDLAGIPDPNGKIVLLSVGMSNTTQEFLEFQRLIASDKEINPAMVAVDGAQEEMTAAMITDPDSERGGQYWETIDTRLQDAGLTRAQVQAVWLKEANARPTEPFPEHARILQQQLEEIARVLYARFPRLRIVYLSSRIYGGFATTPLNPEPYAYESGFAVKWAIADQIEGRDHLNPLIALGPVEAPWLAWGPYLWANDGKARRDGLTWTREDFGPDGTQPSPQGQMKVARLLLQFLKTDPTAKIWFTRREK